MKKISFGRLLRNDRLMIILSVLLAIWLWYVTLSGSANVTTRTISCTLNPANVKNGNLNVMDTEPIAVDVVVEGPWSDLTSLTAEDLRVQLNTSDIQSAGKCRIHVLASRNSQITDYEIVSTSPSMVTLFCDEWVEGRAFLQSAGAISAEAPGITAEGDDLDIGSVSIGAGELPGGMLVVEGPQTIVSRIETFVVQVADEAAITEQQTFTGAIRALDAEGQEVELQPYCTLQRYTDDPLQNEEAELQDLTENTLNVVVTVNARQDVSFTYEVKNAPAGVDLSGIVSMEPASVTLEGERALLAEYTESLSQLTVLDFDSLTVTESSRVIPITLPEGITVVGSGENELSVTLKFNWRGYSSKELTWDLGSDLSNTPIVFQNLPTDKTVELLTHSMTVQVFGKREVISSLTAADLTATVDVSDSSLGTYTLRPTVKKEGVWVFYGDTGYKLYLSIT